MTLYLERDGLACDVADTAEKAISLFDRDRHDLIILDINLPGTNGFQFLREIRVSGANTPVLVVSSRKTEDDLVHGLGMGADEFVVKPFSPRVLVARVHAHLRRSARSRGTEMTTYRFSGYVLNAEAGTLHSGSERIPLTPREMQLLTYLVRVSPRTVGVDELYSQVWGKEYGDRATVAVHIQRLRRKIEEDAADPQLIVNVYGVGYRFSGLRP